MEKYNLPHTLTISNPDRFLLQNQYVTDDGSDMFLLYERSHERGS